MTSEEKLLKIIRSQKETPKSSLTTSQATQVGGTSVEGEEKSFDATKLLKGINFILIISILILLGYNALIYFQDDETGIHTAGVIPRSATKKGESVDAKLTELKPFDDYRLQLEQTDVFEAPWEAPKDTSTKNLDTPLVELTKVLRLIGIVLDADPKAIVEDLKTKQTYFLSIGEEISGAKLKSVDEGKVTFFYNDQEVDITQ